MHQYISKYCSVCTAKISHVLLCNVTEGASNALRQIREIAAVQTYSLRSVAEVTQRQCDGTEVWQPAPVSHSNQQPITHRLEALGQFKRDIWCVLAN